MNISHIQQKRSRPYLICLILVTAPILSGADLTVSADLTVGATVSYSGSRDHFTDVKKGCNVLGGWVETLNYNPVTAVSPLSAQFHASETKTATVVAGKLGSDQYAIRTLALNVQREDTAKASSVTLTMNDTQSFGLQTIHHDGECDREDYYTRPSAPTLAGTITLALSLPKDTWMVKVTTEGPTASLATAADNAFIGQLVTPSDIPTSSRTTQFVYAEPGGSLVKTFSFGAVHTGTTVSGTYSVTFEPIVFAPRTLKPELLAKQVISASQDDTASRRGREQLLNDLMATVAGRSRFESELTQLPTYRVSALARAEFELANTPLRGPLAPELRAAAALASFRSALFVLKSMRPFCKEIAVKGPLDEKPVHTKGLTYAYFALEQAAQAISSYDFKSFQRVLAKLVSFEQSGLRVGDVKGDTAKRQALLDTYEILGASEGADSAFGDVASTISTLLDIFGTIGDGRASAQQLLAQLAAAQSSDDLFRRHFYERMRSFDDDQDPTKKVVASDLSLELQKLDQQVKQIGRRLFQNQRLLSLKELGNDESVLVQMGRLLAFNVNIFSRPFIGGAQPIERLREAFVRKEGEDLMVPVEGYVQALEACLLEGGHK